jgi:O-antigen biosynthesis protein
MVVCIPVYNEERFIARTIASVREQTRTDFAALICDNASTDATGAIARAACAADPRFRYHRHERNIGAVGNFNFAREATDSPFFQWLGGHDRIAPTYLQTMLAAMAARPEVSVAAAHTAWIDEDDRLLRVSHGWMDTVPDVPVLRFAMEPKKNDLCGEINNVIRRERLDGFRLDNRWGTDNVALAHLAYRGPFHYVPEPLYQRRELSHRAQNYMTRLTGEDRADEPRLELVAAMEAQLAVVAARDPLRPVAAYLMRHWLEYRFGASRSRAFAALFGGLDRAKRLLR